MQFWDNDTKSERGEDESIRYVMRVYSSGGKTYNKTSNVIKSRSTRKIDCKVKINVLKSIGCCG